MLDRVKFAHDTLIDPDRLDAHMRTAPPVYNKIKFFAGKHLTKNCPCGQQMSVSHMLLHCPRLQDARHEHCQNLKILPADLQIKNILLLADPPDNCDTMEFVQSHAINFVKFCNNIKKICKLSSF
mmetsp:Transcript_16662/g.31598  ORF Transcript_16662/g.31598 Transcript_16662/m.31598 type:complete len:125 (-) Transcript_16662:98-472(-)